MRKFVFHSYSSQSPAWFAEHVDADFFNFSFPVFSKELTNSIRESGIQTPLLVVEFNDRLILVAGHRRLAIAREAMQEIPLLRGTISDTTELSTVFSNVLSENRAFRTFNAIESARIMQICEENLTLNRAEILQTWLPRIGLNPSLRLYEGLRPLLLLSPSWQARMATGHLSMKRATQLSRLSRAEQGIALEFLENFSLTTSLFDEALANLLILSRREGGDLAGMLAEIRRDLSTEKTADSSAHHLREVLHKRAFPKLQQMEDRFKDCKHALHLPASVSLQPPAFFEGDHFTVRFPFGSPEEMRRNAEFLLQASERPELRDLTDLL